ncbi:hypothetical protein OKN36_13660 [Furfurilactobacillus sp. OKN36]
MLIAGGSGIVPMLSLIAAHPHQKITLYYTAHTEQELIYADELRQLATTRPELTVHLQAGRFDVTQTVSTFTVPNTTYLLSGPRLLGHTWRQALHAHGVSPNKVYYEAFNW